MKAVAKDVFIDQERMLSGYSADEKARRREIGVDSFLKFWFKRELTQGHHQKWSPAFTFESAQWNLTTSRHGTS